MKNKIKYYDMDKWMIFDVLFWLKIAAIALFALTIYII